MAPYTLESTQTTIGHSNKHFPTINIVSQKHILRDLYRGDNSFWFILCEQIFSDTIVRGVQILGRISLHYAPNVNERKMKERFTRTIRKTHDTRNERTIHETNARYTNKRTKWNEWIIRKRKRTNARCTKRTNDTRNERTIHERTNHWSVALYYPMTNDPGSIEVQYSIMLSFEWLLCKLMWLTNLIFYTQLIYINDKLVGKVIG
jgi:hypothetical protein